MATPDISDFYMRYNIVLMGIVTITVVVTAVFISFLVWKIYKLAKKHSLTMERYLSNLKNKTSKNSENKNIEV